MGTSEGFPEIDGSAGTIVWVRRRNGSWWPGRILGPEELSASHLMSPRSGTPVKLLGREDASVDWYNLEKSKRVKAFRCGEFDACIERAEAVQGNPLKKREKYARREDAILHALELEKQQLQDTSQKLGLMSKRMCLDNGLSENIHESDEITDGVSYHSLKADPFSKRFGSYEEEDVGNPLYLGREKYMEQHGYEDGNAEIFQRMRGLQDIGLRSAYSKRKLNAPVTFVNADDIVPPNHGINSKNPSTGRRKRSQNGPVEEAVVKRRDRRRPLVKVLQSSAKYTSDPSTTHDDASMSMPVEGVGAVYRAKRSQFIYSPADDYMNRVEFPPQEMQVSCLYDTKNLFLRSSEDEESFSSGKVRIDENAEEATAGHSDLGRLLVVCEPSKSGLGVTKEQILGSEELIESMLTYGPRPHCNEQASAISANMRGSKWQSKGKRNARVAFKRPSEINDTNHSSTTERPTDQGAIYEDEVNMLKKRTSRRTLDGRFCRRKDDPIYDYYYDDDDIDDDDDDDDDDDNDDDGDDDDEDGDEDDDADDSDMVDGGDGSMENAFISKMHNIQEMTSDDDVTDSDGYSEPGFRGYWEESVGWFNPYYGGHLGISYNPMLVDVDLKVQVSYQREQVPLVSLMSGLNGKAIVGRPLQVEKLEDGSLHFLFPASEIGEGALAFDDDDDDGYEAGNSRLQPVWRTARRTVMHRVPRSRPSAAFGTEETDFIQYSDNEDWSNGTFHDKGLSTKNPDSHSQGSHSDRKILKKQSKQWKKACLSSQKTRTLSSIASEQPVKPERLNLNPISSVPVKLVFSRINEAVGKVTSTQEKIPS